MSKLGVFPFHWSVDALVSHGDEVAYELAKNASSSLAPIKILLGRCLLALEELEVHKNFGMSSVIHLAMSALGHSRKEALTARRVARELQRLPLLTREAEKGRVPWSKLREVVSVATPETEELWLKLCQELPTGKIQKLVALTPKGGIPGQLPAGKGPHGPEYRCRFSPELVVQIERLMQQRSQVQGRPLSFAEMVEQLVIEALAGKPYDEAEEKMKVEAQREFAAEQLAQEPLVRQAQDLARELGLVEEHTENEGGCGCSNCDSPEWSHAGTRDQEANLKEELLELALGGPITSQDQAEAVGPGEQNAPFPLLSLQNRSQQEPTDSQSANLSPWGPTSTRSSRDFGVAHELISRSIAKLRFNPKNRVPTEAQRKAVLRRDRYCCSTPSCPSRMWLELHHIRWYSRGGETLPQHLSHANLDTGAMLLAGHPECYPRKRSGWPLFFRTELSLWSHVQIHQISDL